ncbi:hypothetical protein KQI68_00025 [Peptoniphilus sp. MSJ-1]|uniref:DUF4825 domain-containing protein n=1 Tax=Peptoniphilus ovalis TaxID=2841503 RepID=A0ABS6FE35_9FIRM|nr:hypothetical protein [Peptoniphilus ovalis]MBU5668216.1 hypothetical protein [Peptoniphilus ovalis]
MIKKVLILTFILIFTTSCSKANLYSLKTDLSHKEKVEKLINQLDWENKDPYKIEIKDKTITIIFDNDEDYYKMNLKPYFVNSFYLLILTDAREINYKNNVGTIFSFDDYLANEFLSYQTKKSIDDYKNSEEEFHKLEKFMKNLKVN